MPTLGDLIKRERLRRGMTCQELASKVGQAESCLSDVENMRRGVQAEELLKLADALGLPVEGFFATPKPRLFHGAR